MYRSHLNKEIGTKDFFETASNHWSLVAFTLMVQSAVGSVWCMQAVILWNGGPVDLPQLKYQILVALCLVLAGLAAAMAHLGKPGESLHAVKNVKSSWLSREILSVNIFGGFLAIMGALAHIRPGALSAWALLFGSLAGGVVLYAMTRVYLLRTVPSWNHAGTPLSFLGSALLLGGLLCALIFQLLILFQVISHDAMAQIEYRNIALTAGLVGFILKIMAARANPSRAASSKTVKTGLPVLQAGGIALWIACILAGANPVFQAVLLSLAAVCLISGEIIHRIQFYESYHRVGL